MRAKTSGVLLLVCVLTVVSWGSARAANLTWWSHWATQDTKKVVLNEAKRRFEAKHPGNTVTITYYENNRDHMRYDEYLAAGYPIGSGVAEGACKHLVKDRMELAGMRWEIEGAQAMLSLRAVYLNNLWDQFIAYRIAREQARLYGKDTQHATAA